MTRVVYTAYRDGEEIFDEDSGGVETRREHDKPTSSKPSRSTREFQEKDRKNVYSCLEAFRNRVRSSPRTMTTSGQTFLAWWISCNLCKPCERIQSTAAGNDKTRSDSYSSAGLIVACDDNLFLLHSQWQAS